LEVEVELKRGGMDGVEEGSVVLGRKMPMKPTSCGSIWMSS